MRMLTVYNSQYYVSQRPHAGLKQAMTDKQVRSQHLQIRPGAEQQAHAYLLSSRWLQGVMHL